MLYANQPLVLAFVVSLFTIAAMLVQAAGGPTGGLLGGASTVWPLSFGLAAGLLVVPLCSVAQLVVTKGLAARMVSYAGVLIAYSGIVCLLCPVITILLERLFRLEEHYAFAALGDAYAATWHTAFYGGVFCVAQLAIWLLLHVRVQLGLEREKVVGLSAQVKDAELKSLGYQLRPHFLFNSLNNIAMMVRKGEQEASVEAIVSLSAILSKAMGKDSQPMIALSDELALLDHFIAIEQLKDDRVAVERVVSPEAESTKVPALLLQPIVENAFKFSRESGFSSSVVRIAAEVSGHRLRLTVFNSGEGLRGWSLSDSAGIGLANTVHRLRYIYGTNFSFTTSDQPDGVAVAIELPAGKI